MTAHARCRSSRWTAAGVLVRCICLEGNSVRYSSPIGAASVQLMAPACPSVVLCPPPTTPGLGLVWAQRVLSRGQVRIGVLRLLGCRRTWCRQQAASVACVPRGGCQRCQERGGKLGTQVHMQLAGGGRWRVRVTRSRGAASRWEGRVLSSTLATLDAKLPCHSDGSPFVGLPWSLWLWRRAT